MDVLPNDPDYRSFLEHYLMPNNPVLIRSDTVASWEACKAWTRTVTTDDGSKSGVPREDLDELKALYGHMEVMVAVQQAKQWSESVCAEATFEAQWGIGAEGEERRRLKFGEVVDLWKARQAEGGEGERFYVKDWHLIRICAETTQGKGNGGGAGFYRVPEVFLDDWMNDYYSAETGDDFKFLYMGERGTVTGLHSDVYCSYSWSGNVVGRKLWRLYRPGTGERLTIEQGPGEVIFVPSGWKHEVLNLSPLVISINHNWCNSVNLVAVYDALAQDVEEVEESIADVKELLKAKPRPKETGICSSPGHRERWESEWIEVVQELVKQHSGWNWLTFWKMVRFIVRRDFSRPSASSIPAPANRPSPPLEFVAHQISRCITKFQARAEWGFDPSLGEVVAEIESLIVKSGGMDDQ